jgi:preprotein translocase subunit SecB
LNQKKAIQKKIFFLLELDYGGIFKIENIPDDQLHPFLMIECPRMLFPFVRRVIHDITRDGGYPPLNLDTIDFMAMYRAEVNRLADEQKLN